MTLASEIRELPAPVGLPDYLADPTCPVRQVPGMGWWFSDPTSVEQILGDPRLSFGHEEVFGCPESEFRAHSPNVAGLAQRSGSPHNDLRRLVNRAFTVHAIADRTSGIIKLAHACADELAAHETADGVDLVTHFARRMPYLVMAEIVGLGEDTERLYESIWRWALDDVMGAESVAAIGGQQEAWTVWQTLVDTRRDELISVASPRRGGVLENMLLAQGRGAPVGDRTVSDEDIIGMLMFLFTAGMITVATSLTTLVVHLQAFGQWVGAAERENRLSDEPSAASALAVQITAADPPFPMVRRVALEDLWINGHLVAKGEVVTACVTAAQHDPSQLPLGPDVDAAWRALLIWGRKTHRCLGEALAIAQLTEGLRAMLVRFPHLTIAEYGARAWPAIIPAFPSVRVHLGAT